MRLAIGTVQFGQPYGITNLAGQVPQAEVERILSMAYQSGVRLLDTARLYGESEAVLGALARGDEPFDIVTKTPAFGKAQGTASIAFALLESFDASCAALRREKLYGLLVHQANDLLGPAGGVIWSTMSHLRENGRVGKIGASVYTGAQIDALLQRFDLDLVQLPINALDWRLTRGGQLDRLRARGVEVHARSVFLQGLLLQDLDRLPTKFGSIKHSLTGLRAQFATLGLNLMEGLLAAVLHHPAIDRLVVGVLSTCELRQVLDAYPVADRTGPSVRTDPWAVWDERVLSPPRWAELAD